MREAALYEAYRQAVKDADVDYAVQVAASIAAINGMSVDESVTDTVQSVIISKGYCPCMSKQQESTVCPCAPFRSNKKCICGLFL